MNAKPQLHLDLATIRRFVSDERVASYYANVGTIPFRMHSPFRRDKNASLNWYYSKTTGELLYNDCGTNEGGNVYQFIAKSRGMRFNDVLAMVYCDLKDIPSATLQTKGCSANASNHSSHACIRIRTRAVEPQDERYWGLYGISASSLCKYDIYPISYYWINETIFKADKTAYAYVERKRNNVTYKIYQPMRTTDNNKWISGMDKKTLGLWRFLPERGEIVCVCSSVKDALTLMTHTNIPAFALQGEAMGLSKTVVKELPSRFKRVCIMLDNDEPGMADAAKLSQSTGFENIVMPDTFRGFSGFKDIADARKAMGCTSFIAFMNKLFYGKECKSSQR